MPTYAPDPQFQVVTTYSATDYTFGSDEFPSGRIIRVENGFDTASLWVNNYKSRNWHSKMDAGQNVVINFRYGTGAWTEVFDGVCRFVNLPMSENSLMELKCDGKGYGLEETICTHEYGSESNQPTLNTMRLIINQAILGIVDGHVNNMFTDHVTDTGFSYTSSINTVEDIAGEIKYLYYPGVPNTKALQQLFDVVQAIKGANAGPHWIVDVDGNLLVCTVNASHPTAGYGWTKYYGDSQANATLAENEDFTESNFQEMTKEANYILYHGACVVPSGGDYCENNSASWGTDHPASLTLSDDNAAGNFKVGSYSLKGTTTAAGPDLMAIQYPSDVGGHLSLDIAKMGGAKSAPIFSFYAKRNTEINSFFFTLYRDDGIGTNWADSGELISNLPVDKWTFMSFDLCDKWMENPIGTPTLGTGTALWSDVDTIYFYINEANNANNKYVWLDGVNFSGAILRGARQAAAYSATDPMKVKVVHDNIAKGDSLIAATDTGTIARLAYAELLRAQTTPIIGWIKTPLLINLLPGQILHIHGQQKDDGTFRIDKDMRATRVIHEWGGSESGMKMTTTTQLTDDVTNSYVRSSFADQNTLLAATREYATRQAITSKLGEIDITQTILENSY